MDYTKPLNAYDRLIPKLSDRLLTLNALKYVTDKKPSSLQTLTMLGSGLLMGIAPVNAWPLAWVAMVPLWVLLGRSQPSFRIAIGHAAIWGFAFHGVALSWVTGLHPMMWMGIPWLGSITITLLSWAFITAWGAAIGMIWVSVMMALSRQLAQAGKPFAGASRVLIGTTLWCLLEWIWSRGPLYWSPVNYTQSPYNLLGLQLGQLSGPLTITAAILAVNGLLAEAWMNRRKGSVRPQPKRLGWAIALFLGLHLIGLGLYSRPLNDLPNQALTVGLIQGNIPTDQKLTTAGIKTSRQIYLKGYELLAAQGADLVITPEGAIPQVWDTFLQDQNLFQRAVVKAGVPLLLGTFVHQAIDDPQTPLTQSLLMLTAEGRVAGRYNKVRLVPLGEYVPFENIIGAVINRLSPFGESMVPGNVNQQLNTPFGPMTAGICYESVFSDLFRRQVDSGGQAIITASNNDPYSPRQMIQHHGQDVMRAIETDRWEVRVTNTGISGVVDPRGRSLWLSTPNEYTTHMATIYRRETRSPYVRWGNWLTPLLVAGSAIALYRRRVRL